MTEIAVGIDVGGTGIKGALVDVATGQFIGERVRFDTPEGGEPEDIVRVVREVLTDLGAPADAPVGICFPSAIRHGVTLLAANISLRWIGLHAEEFFEEELSHPITFVNDADAAGFGEVTYGAARGQQGLVIMTTLGTGIGGALIYNGVLIPNAELGHLELHGHDAEKKASAIARQKQGISFKKWARKRLQPFYSHLEMLFSPELFIVGGGVSKFADEFLPYLNLRTPIVPATLLNQAGILGAARLAYNESLGSASI